MMRLSVKVSVGVTVSGVVHSEWVGWWQNSEEFTYCSTQSRSKALPKPFPGQIDSV